jgi:TolB protein
MKPPISARIAWLILAVGLLASLAVVFQAMPPVAAQSDAGTIAYVRYNDETGDEVWLIEPDGSNNRRIYTVGKPDPESVFYILGLAWRPDAAEIAFNSNHEATCSLYESDIYAIQPDGGGYRRITNAPACDQLANYPKGSVRVEVQNWTGYTQMFNIYLQGAPSIQGIYLAPAATGVVTFNDVADFGDSHPQFAVAVWGRARWFGSASADVQPGATVDATPSLDLTAYGYHEEIFAKSPTWHSDGSKLGYIFSTGILRQIESNSPLGAYGESLLADGARTPLYISDLAWSPQPALADQLLYKALDFSGSGIYSVTAGSHDRGELLVSIGALDSFLGLAWLPDGSGFVYALTEDYEQKSNLFEYNFASRQVTRLTNFTDEYVGHPSVSPSGQEIVFVRSPGLQDAPVDLWVMSRNGTEMRRLVENGHLPAWSLRQPQMPTVTPTPSTSPTSEPSPTPTATVSGTDQTLYLPLTVR